MCRTWSLYSWCHPYPFASWKPRNILRLYCHDPAQHDASWWVAVKPLVFHWKRNCTEGYWKKLQHKVRSLDHKVVLDARPTYEWDALQRLRYVKEDSNSDMELCVHLEALPQLLQLVLKPMRLGPSEKAAFAQELNLPWTHEIPEQSVIESLRRALPETLTLVPQYGIDTYRLDLYIEQLHLGVEIDEHGHQRYTVSDEDRRTEVITRHGIKLLRFNPDTDHVSDLIRKVYDDYLNIQTKSSEYER